MKAIVQDVYGSADVLELEDIDKPAVGDGDVRVQVRAAGVDPSVWHIMTGLPYVVRLMGLGLRRPKGRVRGLDVSGTVEAVGKDVTEFEPGDDVFGTCDGSFAEFACARPATLAPKPANLTFEQAAAVPVSGCTALQGLRDRGKISSGQRVLVIGAAGGVGSFAVQIAKHFGAEVTGVCSTAKLEMVRSLGADHLVDYSQEDFTGWVALLRHRPRHGRAPPLVAPAARPGSEGNPCHRWRRRGRRLAGGFDRQLRASLVSPFVSQELRSVLAKVGTADFAGLERACRSDRVTPAIGEDVAPRRRPRRRPLPRRGALPGQERHSLCEPATAANRSPDLRTQLGTR